MPTQTTASIQNLFNGDVNASVPAIGWRSVSLFPFDRSHANSTTTLAFRGNFQTHEFSAAATNELHTRFTCPPDRRDGTDLYFKWHFSTNTAGSGDVRLELQIAGADEGGTYSPGATLTLTEAVDTQYEHYIATFGPTGSTRNLDATFMLRFSRLGAAGPDTYANTIVHLDFQAWYQTDRIATPNYLPPYYS